MGSVAPGGAGRELSVTAVAALTREKAHPVREPRQAPHRARAARRRLVRGSRRRSCLQGEEGPKSASAFLVNESHANTMSPPRRSAAPPSRPPAPARATDHDKTRSRPQSRPPLDPAAASGVARGREERRFWGRPRSTRRPQVAQQGGPARSPRRRRGDVTLLVDGLVAAGARPPVSQKADSKRWIRRRATRRRSSHLDGVAAGPQYKGYVTKPGRLNAPSAPAPTQPPSIPSTRKQIRSPATSPVVVNLIETGDTTRVPRSRPPQPPAHLRYMRSAPHFRRSRRASTAGRSSCPGAPPRVVPGLC